MSNGYSLCPSYSHRFGIEAIYQEQKNINLALILTLSLPACLNIRYAINYHIVKSLQSKSQLLRELLTICYRDYILIHSIIFCKLFFSFIRCLCISAYRNKLAGFTWPIGFNLKESIKIPTSWNKSIKDCSMNQDIFLNNYNQKIKDLVKG